MPLLQLLVLTSWMTQSDLDLNLALMVAQIRMPPSYTAPTSRLVHDILRAAWRVLLHSASPHVTCNTVVLTLLEGYLTSDDLFLR
jgi:hypothetical protein